MSTIVVVDDDAGTRFVLRMILEDEGHRVMDAPHGAAALALIAPDALPDVVMTDLVMPILNGEELILRLRSEPATAAIPIVIVSGNEAAARALHSSGLVEGVVRKPFEPADLLQCLRALSGSAPERADRDMDAAGGRWASSGRRDPTRPYATHRPPRAPMQPVQQSAVRHERFDSAEESWTGVPDGMAEVIAAGMQEWRRPHDCCPFVSRNQLNQCKAHHALIFDPEDQNGRLLPAALTCSYLGVGDDYQGQRFYPQCSVGDETARQAFVERRNAALNAEVTASLLADFSSGPPDTGVMVAGDDGRYVAVNSAMCAMLGYEREDMILGMTVWQLTPERYGGNGATLWRDFIAAGEGFGTYQLSRADGSAATFDFVARANVIPGLHVSILTPSKGRQDMAERRPAPGA